MAVPAHESHQTEPVPAPEVDEVYVNGYKLPQNLLSPNQEDGNGKWIKYECEVPLDILKFPKQGDKANGITPAENQIQIKVDVCNSDGVWAVAIDWVYLQFVNFPRPIVFIHGKGDNSLGWKIYDDNGRGNIDTGGWYKWFEDRGFVVGAVDIWGEGDPFSVMEDKG